MTKTRRLPIFLEVIFLALLALFYASHTLILSEFPKLYSTAIAPRLQTDALLQGKISLSPEPFGLPHNFIWAGENGMQQNWGMGVPFLRLPFEWLSGKCGLGPFPDRLILLFYLFLTLLVLSLALRTAVESLGMDAYGRIGIFIRFYLIIWVLFCPPMAGLAEKLRVYEETIFYGCLYAYVLLSLLMVYLIRPSSRLFIGLCLASGLAWVIRPTLLAYGTATFAVAFVQACRNKAGRILIWGLVAFCTGLLVELWLNHLRFGSMMQFGYLNTYADDFVEYIQQFGYPFAHEPLLRAFKELMGALFFNYAWISPTIRFRSRRLMLFNISHLIVMGTGFMVLLLWPAVAAFRKKYLPTGLPVLKTAGFILSWGALSFLFFAFFYLRWSALCGRYLAEVVPAYNAMLIALVMLGCGWIMSWAKEKDKIFLIIFLMYTGLIFYFNDSPIFDEAPRFHEATDKNGVQQQLRSFAKDIAFRADLPESFSCGRSYPHPGLARQFEGWDISKSCSVNALTLLFLPSSDCLSLSYTVPLPYRRLPVRVKRGFTFLKLVDTKVGTLKEGEASVTQRFCSRKAASNKPAMYLIAWVDPDHLNRHDRPAKLQQVSVDELMCRLR